MMLSAGEHPMWVAKQMGHTDRTMIARVYGRWMPSADLNAGEKAENLWSKESDEKSEVEFKCDSKARLKHPLIVDNH